MKHHDLLERARAALAEPEGADGEVPRIGHILRLAEIIREVDGKHDKGAAALAEAILSHPGIRSAGLTADLLAEPPAEGPTDEDLVEALRRLLIWPPRSTEAACEQDYTFARAVLARWGRPAAAPVPEPGEVAGIAEWLNKRGQMADLGTRDWYFRAATLLQQQDAPAPVTVPVPVSERLPGPEDCDDQGRCWMFGKVEGDWRLISRIDPGIPKLRYCFSHWLPANALPLPAPEETK
jgi:hypothetical protein